MRSAMDSTRSRITQLSGGRIHRHASQAGRKLGVPNAAGRSQLIGGTPPVPRRTVYDREAMKTRAAVYVEISQPMIVEEIELPDPGPTQLLVKHFASGICHT